MIDRKQLVSSLCTMSQWGWHTKPVNGDRYDYTLKDLVMTEFEECTGRHLVYPKEKMPGNEEVYDWLRQNPHRLNLARIRFLWEGQEIKEAQITDIHQELKLYEGVLESSFSVEGVPCRVLTACHNEGKDILGFEVECEALQQQEGFC